MFDPKGWEFVKNQRGNFITPPLNVAVVEATQKEEKDEEKNCLSCVEQQVQ